MESELSRRILENLHTAVLRFGPGLRLEYVNPAAEMLFGISARKIRGATLDDLSPDPGELANYLHEALEGGQVFTEREMQLALPGAKVITVDCTVSPLMEPHHEAAVLVELSQVDRHLRISREEHLLAQNAATRALVRGMAHEIKNPLGGIRGAAQLLERQLGGDGLKEYTRIIIGEADRLQNLVDDMLGPNKPPRKDAVNLHEVLEHVRSLVLAEVPAGVTILRDYDPSIPLMYADRDQLVQAILNIVRNAVEAVGQDGEIRLQTRVERQFTIGNKRHKLVARLDIKDNGPGIPEAVQERIFYPMITGRAEGTGMGLSIAQSLINRHGGLIACESVPGETTFTILLPLENGEENDRQGEHLGH